MPVQFLRAWKILAARIFQTIAERYTVLKRIGGGSFGEVFEGKELSTEHSVAIKVEPVTSVQQCLLYEAKVMKGLQGLIGVPRVRWSGCEGNYNLLVMDLLGASLQRKFEGSRRELSMKDFVQLSLQLVERLQAIHERCYIHRDIKPENFTVGLGRYRDLVYAIDFGLAKKYCDPKTGQHVPYRENKSLTGTARYASVNAHMGLEQSRRDDLEGLLYVLVYFLKGELPWMGVVARSKPEKYTKIMEKKMATTVESLCKGLPQEIASIFRYVKGLRFEEAPNYLYIRSAFLKIAETQRISLDYVFDWKPANAIAIPFKIQRRAKRLMGRRESMLSSYVSGYSEVSEVASSQHTATAAPPHITLEVRKAAKVPTHSEIATCSVF